MIFFYFLGFFVLLKFIAIWDFEILLFICLIKNEPLHTKLKVIEYSVPGK